MHSACTRSPLLRRLLPALTLLAAPLSAQILFAQPVASSPGYSAASPMAAGDVNGDGFADLVLIGGGSPQVHSATGPAPSVPRSPTGPASTPSPWTWPTSTATACWT